jgi:hypothetical protein
MKVLELIETLAALPPDAEIVTNCCEATPQHEDVVDFVEVKEMRDGRIFVGTNADHHVR